MSESDTRNLLHAVDGSSVGRRITSSTWSGAAVSAPNAARFATMSAPGSPSITGDSTLPKLHWSNPPPQRWALSSSVGGRSLATSGASTASNCTCDR